MGGGGGAFGTRHAREREEKRTKMWIGFRINAVLVSLVHVGSHRSVSIFFSGDLDENFVSGAIMVLFFGFPGLC
jgi:hypothetical protein